MASRSPSRDVVRLQRRPVAARPQPVLTQAQYASATLVADWVATVMWRVAALMGWDTDDVEPEPEPVRPTHRRVIPDPWDLDDDYDGLSRYDRVLAERRARELRIERHAAALADTHHGCCSGRSHHHC